MKEFAKGPHPLGTAEHDRVRDYLVAQIKALGLTVEIQRTTGVTPRYQVAGTVENIVTRLKGSGGRSDAVMLSAHYDSVPAGPGAGDDGAGVAALLETMRALRVGPGLKNDLIFLFTDGEEDGMLGASAFANESPTAKTVRVVANFEARGNSGSSQLFETSVGNGRLVKFLTEAVSHPTGWAMTYEVYKHMPNDTDLTVFKQAGMAGLNFAFIGHWEAYHTPLDNPEQLNLGSLQQHGEYALGLARKLGNADLSQLTAPDAVYFAIPGGPFLHYSSESRWPLVILGAAAFLAACFYVSGADQIRVSGVVLGILALLGLVVLSALCGWLFANGVSWLHRYRLPDGDVVKSVPYTLSLLAFLATVWTVIYKKLRKKISWGSFFLSGTLILLLSSIAAAKWMPGGSYVFGWPLLAALLSGVVAGVRSEEISRVAAVVLCALTLPALVIFVPLFKGMYESLGLSPLGAPMLGAFLAVFFIALVPSLETLLPSSGWWIPAGALSVTLILFAVASSVTRYSQEHPKPEIVMYALDADSGKALWASPAERPDLWAKQYLGSAPVRAKLRGFYPDWIPFELLQHDAPMLQLRTAEISVTENGFAGDVRTLRLHIASPRHARVIAVEVPDNEVLDGWVNERRLGQPSESRWNRKGTWAFDYANPSPQGIELRLQTRGNAPVRVVVVERSLGLPEIPGVSFAPRSLDSMPIHSGDQTMVRRSFVF